jgi:class 3 adenylate cyclase
VCPHCRGLREEHDALAGLTPSSRCGACDVEFSTAVEESVEVTFRVHPSIREIAERVYCSAEPATREHIRVQRDVAAGSREVVHPQLAVGRYRLRAGKTAGFLVDVEAEGPTAVLPWPATPPTEIVTAGPALAVELINDGDLAQTFVIERATWSDHALRPSALLSFQDFRDLFAEEYIGADVRLAVGEQTLLFTDVVGSTAFYADRGDPAAFVEIKRHFDEVFAIVRANRGAVIKTIGDAVMAAFVNPADAVRASHLIQRAFPVERVDTPIRLRISLNTGPCIAVRLNANADYFGGTVNIAAKLQALAETCQIAMSETTYAAPGVAAYVAEHGGAVAELTYTSKALPAPIKVRQWTVG